MNAPRFDTAAVVLGMHRSGTSALAGVLSLAGFAAPRTLIPSSPVNERGFWESEAIKSVNDDLLEKLGLTWHSLRLVNEEDLAGPSFANLRRKAIKSLVDEFDSNSSPVIKDPRMCRLMSFWRKPLADTVRHTVFPIIVRNPLEVAASLQKRNDFDSDLGLMLWLRYYLDAEHSTRSDRRAFVSYDRLLDDWRSELARLADGLGIKSRPSASQARRIDEFLSGGLRHHRTVDEQVLIELEGLPVLQEAYRTLADWSAGRAETPEHRVRFDHLRNSLSENTAMLASAFEEVRLSKKRLTVARARADDVASELAQARQAAESLDEIRAAALQQLQILQTLNDLITKSPADAIRFREEMITRVGSLGEALEAFQTLTVTTAGQSEKIDELRSSVIKLRKTAEAAGAERVTNHQFQTGIAALETSLRDLSPAMIAELGRTNKATIKEVRSLRTALKNGIAQLPDRKFAAALTELSKEQSAALDNVTRAQADGQQRLEAALSGIEEVLNDRAKLEKSLKEALGLHAEVRNQLLQVEAAASDAAEAHRVELASIVAEHERQFLDLSANYQTKISDSEQQLAARGEAFLSLQGRHDLLDSELKVVKRKYRSTQFQLEREQHAHRATKDDLREATITVAQYHGTLSWRLRAASQSLRDRAHNWARRFIRADRQRRKEQLAAIQVSPLFDSEWYLSRYPDIASAGLDPVCHFFDYGWRENRDPGPSFSTKAYLKANADVARAGINPLLHFIEFGFSEGRAAAQRAATALPPSPPPPALEFEPAIACASYPSDEDVPVRWLRAARLTAEDSRLLTIGETPIGYLEGRAFQSLVAPSFDALARLSGIKSREDAAKKPDIPEAGESRVRDLWFVSTRQLRSRWQIADKPLVVRAYQLDPEAGDTLSMVGEGLVKSSLDFVDFNLSSRYFPVLFIFSEIDGLIIDCDLLAFPSLCRGSTHYPELLALTESAPDRSRPDPIATGSSIARDFLALEQGEDVPLVTEILVELDGADGSQPLFQEDFRRWLEQVPRICLKGQPEEPQSVRDTYLSEALALTPKEVRASGGGQLILASDMTPTLSILSARSAANKAIRRDVFAPLLVATPDHSQPAVLVDMPRGRAPALRNGSPEFPPAWPRFLPSKKSGLPDALPPAAIRSTSGRPLADAELMMPVTGEGLPLAVQRGEAVTWLINPSDWHGDSLKLGLESLALQQGAKLMPVRIAGSITEEVRSLVEKLFDGRVEFADTIADAIRDISTPLIGYLGGGVILHDRRCATALSALLQHEGVASVTCVIVNAEKKGKGWHVSIADSGRLDRSGQSARPFHEHAEYVQRLWRSTYPASSPSRDLWITRSSDIAAWAAQSDFLGPADGMHLCTSLVTASYADGRTEYAAQISLPPADQVNVARMEVLFG